MTELKQFTRKEVAETDRKFTRIIIHDKVYDVTQFLNEHPGGEEVLLDHKGVDASEDFDDVGHSADAHELMKKYMVGEIIDAEKKHSQPKKGWVAGQEKHEEAPKSSFTMYAVVGIIAALLFALWYM
ncbi:cytochrome b5-like [Chelonus insularis]|uniref:cytochrome b5-like n=1 Tax=Chelonus insularis TaxID=460826 RepID=UPI0015885BB2|nr:cytochrome b5-like [Chelonus insularis]